MSVTIVHLCFSLNSLVLVFVLAKADGDHVYYTQVAT